MGSIQKQNSSTFTSTLTFRQKIQYCIPSNKTSFIQRKLVVKSINYLELPYFNKLDSKDFVISHCNHPCFSIHRCNHANVDIHRAICRVSKAQYLSLSNKNIHDIVDAV